MPSSSSRITRRCARGRTPQAAGRCRQPVPSRFSSFFQSPSQWLGDQRAALEYEASPRRIRVVGYGLGIPLDGRRMRTPAGFQPPIQPRMRGEPRLRVPKRLWNRILLSVRARVLAQRRARARRRAPEPDWLRIEELRLLPPDPRVPASSRQNPAPTAFRAHLESPVDSSSWGFITCVRTCARGAVPRGEGAAEECRWCPGEDAQRDALMGAGRAQSKRRARRGEWTF